MERLTIRTQKGAALKMADSYKSEYAARKDLMQRYLIAVDRLAAYEDTGLEPEEIEDLVSVREITPEAEYAINKHANSLIERMDALLHQDDSELAAYRALGSIDHLRELVQAEKDGQEVYRLALDTWGADAQILIAFEEMSELQKELCKHARGRDNREEISEEIADVLIMLDQMMILHDCKQAVKEWKQRKLKRLADRLTREEAGAALSGQGGERVE